MHVAMTIINKIFDMDVGFIYVITSWKRLYEVVHGLLLTILEVEISSLPILTILIKYFHCLA